MKRAIAVLGKARFLLDSTEPTRVFVEEQCARVSASTGQLRGGGWHTAGSVKLVELRRSHSAGCAVQSGTGRRCVFAQDDAHIVLISALVVGPLLVAVDHALEAGVPVTRKPRDLDARKRAVVHMPFDGKLRVAR